jgi:hypothetical protein
MKQYVVAGTKDFISWEKVQPLTDFSCPGGKEKAPETQFQAYHNQSHLFFRYVALGAKPLVYVKENDKMEVLNSERVEIFFRRDHKMKPYFCLEIDPHGRVLDYKADYYRHFDRKWQWQEPLFLQTNIQHLRYTVQGRFSLVTLENLGLLKNKEIQVGLFRGHCTKLSNKNATMQWISWVDPKTQIPDFHVPDAFGKFLLTNI